MAWHLFYFLCSVTDANTSTLLNVLYLFADNEDLADLLNVVSPHDRRPLKLMEDLQRGVVCHGLEEFPVLNTKDLLEQLQRGIYNRHTAATLKNQNSSRSHGIFTFKLTVKEVKGADEVIRNGVLHLVDLAGSESVGRSGASGDRAREAGSINQSLLTLGRVITGLVDHHPHIPYRDSKLTRLLQESLGGRAKTSIIATLSPVQSSVEETMSTLDYAARARSVTNKPLQNSSTEKKIVMKEYFAELESLKSQLQLSREKNGIYVDPVEYDTLRSRLATQESQITDLESTLKVRVEEIKTLKGEKSALTESLEITKKNLELARAYVKEAKRLLYEARLELWHAKAELKATEAVVSEQVDTESTLTKQAVDVLADVKARQIDIANLFSKIDRCTEKETERITDTVEFAQQLIVCNNDLKRRADVLAASSNTHSTAINSGLACMVSSAKESSCNLKSSIHEDMASLLSQSSAAKSEAQKTCERLKTDLRGAGDRVSVSMGNIEKDMIKWLMGADVAASGMQEQLLTQSELLEKLKQEVYERCAAMEALTERWLAEQKSAHSDFAVKTSALHDSVWKELDDFKKQAETEALKNKASFKAKSNALEKVSFPGKLRLYYLTIPPAANAYDNDNIIVYLFSLWY